MPQFDLYIYLTCFFIFCCLIYILYIIISVYLSPHIWKIIYFRYLKEETNNLFEKFCNFIKICLNYIGYYIYYYNILNIKKFILYMNKLALHIYNLRKLFKNRLL